MGLGSIYKKIALLSPRTEIILRKGYWAMMPLLHKFVSSRDLGSIETHEKADFSKVIDYLREIGVKKGDIMIVHSSFDSLKATGLDAESIINVLLDIVGEEGTLAMPAIRDFPEEGTGIDFLKKYIRDEVPEDVVYDLHRAGCIGCRTGKSP